MTGALSKARGLAPRLVAALAAVLFPLAWAATETGVPTATVSPRLPGYGPRVFGDHPSVEQLSSLGRRIFTDESLSTSGRLSCASCHDPANAYGPPGGIALQGRKAGLDKRSARAIPTLRYLSGSIPFTEHWIDDEDGHGDDGGPTGGLTWDGQVQTPHEQALIPLFARREYANANPAALAARVRRATWSNEFEAAFSGNGERVFDDPARVVGWVTAALEAYQQDAAEFAPYSSKYDAYLRRHATLDAQEARGLDLFERPDKGNCASCHPNTITSDGGLPRFTDSAYSALGVPRNGKLLANRDPRHFDLGLCANGRPDFALRVEYCGLFRTPTLRNVATRAGRSSTMA